MSNQIIIDQCDYGLWISRDWRIDAQGYVVSGHSNGIVKLHRLVMNNPKKQVDHIDGNKLNNSRLNLRIVTNQQNQFNSKLRIDNKHGLKGVHKTGNTYWSSIKLDQEIFHLGSYSSPEEAHVAYCFAAIDLFGEYANGGY